MYSFFVSTFLNGVLLVQVTCVVWIAGSQCKLSRPTPPTAPFSVLHLLEAVNEGSQHRGSGSGEAYSGTHLQHGTRSF
jgi:hypothetical protein